MRAVVVMGSSHSSDDACEQGVCNASSMMATCVLCLWADTETAVETIRCETRS